MPHYAQFFFIGKSQVSLPVSNIIDAAANFFANSYLSSDAFLSFNLRSDSTQNSALNVDGFIRLNIQSHIQTDVQTDAAAFVVAYPQTNIHGNSDLIGIAGNYPYNEFNVVANSDSQSYGYLRYHPTTDISANSLISIQSLRTYNVAAILETSTDLSANITIYLGGISRLGLSSSSVSRGYLLYHPFATGNASATLFAEGFTTVGDNGDIYSVITYITPSISQVVKLSQNSVLNIVTEDPRTWLGTVILTTGVEFNVTRLEN